MENQFCCVDSPVKELFDEITTEEVEKIYKSFELLEKNIFLIDKDQILPKREMNIDENSI
jgi:hypothetical protein